MLEARLSSFLREGQRLQVSAAAVGAVALAVVLLLLPNWLSGYWLRITTSVLMFATLAQAWNIITGFTGYPAFGNTAFFGVGAYALAILVTKAGLGIPAAIVLAGLAAAAFCAVIGLPILRLQGHYFAIATLALSLFVREAAANLGWLTNGAIGIVLPTLASGSPEEITRPYYYLMLLVLVACCACTWWVSVSRFGYGLRSIKADEDAAACFGINTTLYKLVAWVLSAFFTGLAGAVWALWITFIDPQSAFNLAIAVKFSVMALLGGLGTVAGPVLGALLVEVLTQAIWGAFYAVHLAVLGLAIMLIVLLMPGGLMQLLHDRLATAKRLLATPSAKERWG